MLLKEKVVIVTGAAKGIGKGIAEGFFKEGACVIQTDISEKEVVETFEELKKKYGNNKGFPMRVDVTNNSDVEKMVKEAIDRFNKIDVLVNNAGVCSSSLVIELPEKEWDRIMTINVKGVFLCCRAVARQMIRQKSGKIINTSSGWGKIGSILFAHYCASKFAVIAFTQALALELAPYGINVNAVCPANIDTDMNVSCNQVFAKHGGIRLDEYQKRVLDESPLHTLGQPQDIAKLVLFLASKDADYMTGQAININGGVILH